MKSLDTFHYNVFGHERNPIIKHVNSQINLKKVREFFFKNQVVRTFLKGLDRKDEKLFFNSLKFTEYDPAERLIRKNTFDRGLIFVGSGQFIAFKDTENEIFNEGSILGIP